MLEPSNEFSATRGKASHYIALRLAVKARQWMAAQELHREATALPGQK